MNNYCLCDGDTWFIAFLLFLFLMWFLHKVFDKENEE